MDKKFDLENRVYNKRYGAGTVIWKGFGRNWSLNLGVKFDEGGPQGWADKATNDIADLELIN